MAVSFINSIPNTLRVESGDEEILEFRVQGTSVATFSGVASQSVNINAPLIENNQTSTTSYTIPVGKNAFSSGPVQIPINTIVRVSPGSFWTII